MRLTVDITQVQYDALEQFANTYNITISDILSNYIADLVQINSNGSDERELARRYFERTELSWMYR
jgi:hypothetical protein